MSDQPQPAQPRPTRDAETSPSLGTPLRAAGLTSRPELDALAEAVRTALSPAEAARLLEEFRQLCLSPAAEPELLDSMVKTLRAAGYKQEKTQVLREAMASPEANPHVGALWMRGLVGSNFWDRRYPGGMDELCRQGEIGRRAVIEFLEAAAAKRKGGLVRRAMRKHGRWLRQHPVGWRVAARALVSVRRYRQTVRWFSRRSQTELDLPLLYCQALALRGACREQEARAIVKAALALPGADEQFPVLRLWDALEEALAGNTAGAASTFKAVKPLGWDDDSNGLFYLVRGMIRVQQAEPDSRQKAFDNAFVRIGDHFRRVPVFRREMMLRRQYRRCLWNMAARSGKWGTGLLALWLSADSVALLVPLLAIPGLQLFAPLYALRLCLRRQGVRKRPA